MGDEAEPTFEALLDAAVLGWRLDEIRAGRLEANADDRLILRKLGVFQRMRSESWCVYKARQRSWESLLEASERHSTPAEPGGSVPRAGEDGQATS